MAQTQTGSRSVSVKMVVALLLVVLALMFVFQNTGSKNVHFLFWSTSMPAWVWLLAVFVAGVVVGSVFPWFRRRR